METPDRKCRLGFFNVFINFPLNPPHCCTFFIGPIVHRHTKIFNYQIQLTMSVLALEQELQSMTGQGQMMEAFEKFYADNVVMHEATGEVREGKDANRKFEEQWMQMVKEVHDGGIGAMTANEDTGHTCTESWIDVTFQDGNRMKMEEVSVKKWENGQIVHERFYYNAAGMGESEQ